VSLEIKKKPCKHCGQDTVITDDGVFARHRHPAPRDKGHYVFSRGQMVLGQWCLGSGEKP